MVPLSKEFRKSRPGVPSFLSIMGPPSCKAPDLSYVSVIVGSHKAGFVLNIGYSSNINEPWVIRFSLEEQESQVREKDEIIVGCFTFYHFVFCNYWSKEELVYRWLTNLEKCSYLCPCPYIALEPPIPIILISKRKKTKGTTEKLSLYLTTHGCSYNKGKLGSSEQDKGGLPKFVLLG